MKSTNEKVYEKSNKIVSVALNSFDKKYFANLLKCSEDIKERHKEAQKLLDYLCKKFGIVNVPLIVTDKPQPHSTDKFSNRLVRKTQGCYKYKSITRTPISITIWNKTAVRQQPISIKVFAETLLHEFIHHYDICYLKLDVSLHTSGFYKRISDLNDKLVA